MQRSPSEKPVALEIVQKPPHSMDIECSLPSSKQPTTSLYHDTNLSRPSPLIISLLHSLEIHL